MSCQGQGYAWEVICVLCSTVAQSDWRSVVVIYCALLAEDFPQPFYSDEPQCCPSSFLALAPQGLQAANRWLDICALVVSRGRLWKWCTTRQNFLWDERQAHIQRCQILTSMNNLEKIYNSFASVMCSGAAGNRRFFIYLFYSSAFLKMHSLILKTPVASQSVNTVYLLLSGS